MSNGVEWPTNIPSNGKGERSIKSSQKAGGRMSNRVHYGKTPIRERPYYNPSTVYEKTDKLIKKGKWAPVYNALTKPEFGQAEVIQVLLNLRTSIPGGITVTKLASRYLRYFLVKENIRIKS